MKDNINPPRLARKFIEWYCRNAHAEDLLGDMVELYRRETKEMSKRRAQLRYWKHVTSLIFSYAIRRRKRPRTQQSIFMNFNMIRSYITVARRTMAKNKSYAVINVLGLTLGMSACLIVYLIVSHELSFDKFHADRDRIYRINTTQPQADKKWSICIAAPAYPLLRDEYAGAEAIAGYHHYSAKVSYIDNGQEKNFERNSGNMIITDPAYFKIFQYQWLAGSLQGLAKPQQVVLTESRARFYFGDKPLQDVMGQTLAYNDSLELTVAGVVKDWKENSDFTATDFISFSTIESTFLKNEIRLETWGILMHSSQAFIKLKEGSNPQQVSSAISSIIRKHTEEPMSLTLQALPDIHFANNDDGESTVLPTLYTLSGLAAFILIVASINFINLSTAQSIRRVREIGIRKAMGSLKKQIVFQFLSETFILSLLAVVLSLLILRPLLSMFASFVPPGIALNPLDLSTWIFIAVLIFFVSLLAGTYPALVVSAYHPTVSLSGKIKSTGNQRWSLRKSLIVFQFGISLFFIVATLVINSQMDFIRNTDKGFNTSNVITFRTNWLGKVSTVKALGEKLRNITGVEDVALQSVNPMGFAWMGNTIPYEGKQGKIDIETSVKSADDHFIPLYQIRLRAGRNISPGDSVREIVVNETFVSRMGLNSPDEAVGEKLMIANHWFTIVGVVQDFHQLSFHVAIGPAMIAPFHEQLHAVAVKISPAANNAEVLENITREFKSLYPDEAFDYHSIEEEIGWLHDPEKRTADLARIAMIITVFISCIGVFGLAMFTAEMRTKEIGIRKVLGATALNISTMLTREFVVLIIIAFVIASPVAWYFMHDWLLTFTYHTNMSIWIFLLAGISAIAIALIAVSFQSVRAALGNPVDALRSE